MNPTWQRPSIVHHAAWTIAIAAIAACSVKRSESHTESHTETSAVTVTTTPALDNARLERDLAAQWRRDGGPIDRVSCPGPIAKRVGTSFRCTAAYTGGDTLDATVTLIEVDGDRIAWSFEFDGDVFMAPREANGMRTRLAAKFGETPAIDCGATRRFDPAAPPTCTVTLADGQRGTARFQLRNGVLVWKLD